MSQFFLYVGQNLTLMIGYFELYNINKNLLYNVDLKNKMKLYHRGGAPVNGYFHGNKNAWES